MGRKPRHICLSTEDFERLTLAHQKGLYQGRRSVRGQILLSNHLGKPISALQTEFDLCQPSVSRLLTLYETEGLEAALSDKARSGAPVKITPVLEAHVSALACSEAPEGRSRWTLELLQHAVIQLKHIDSISDESIRTI